MNTQLLSKIRPVWVAIGAIIFALCAGVAICMAVFGVGMSVILSPRSTPIVQPTRTQVAAAPTATITLASTPSQIPLPGFSTLPPPPVATGAVNFPAAPNSADPAGTVRSYYQWVDENRYDLTWPMLSANFKQTFNCCAPNYNYTGYVDWWNSVDRIEAVDVHTVRHDGNTAVVYMELHYLMRAGGRSVDRAYIHLVYDPAAGWLFENKTDTL